MAETTKEVNIFLKEVNTTMGDANKFKTANKRVNKFQLMIAKKQIQMDKQAEAFIKELREMAEQQRAASQAGITLAGDFSKLQKLYEEKMKDYTFDILYEFHRYKLARTYAFTEEPQHKVLNEYCRLVAEKSVKAIQHYVNILKLQGLIKEETTKDNKAADKRKAAAKKAAETRAKNKAKKAAEKAAKEAEVVEQVATV